MGDGERLEVSVVKDHLLGFVQKLQERYPFKFAVAYRNLESEVNKQTQERLTTYFLFGAISELSGLEPAVKEKIWALGALLCKQVGKGGENFCPHEFNPAEKTLAEEIGEKHFDVLLQKAEELSVAMKFKIGPVNSAEHVVAWTFRYVGQLLKAAKWESLKH
ncbi:MAG: hypothetical protein HY735_33170 [Verrucomicrobia bacterium]|nr:hypothetical protein [Verrucomicrobiota bacterium]